MKTKILNRIDQLLTTEQKTVTPKTNQLLLNKERFPGWSQTTLRFEP